jgi:hypothetical protein
MKKRLNEEPPVEKELNIPDPGCGSCKKMDNSTQVNNNYPTSLKKAKNGKIKRRGRSRNSKTTEIMQEAGLEAHLLLSD